MQCSESGRRKSENRAKLAALKHRKVARLITAVKKEPRKRLSHSNDPANPAPRASAPASAPKPQVSKPHITKPSISFGLKVSDLILRDTIQLQAPTFTPVDDNALPGREKMARLGKLVLSQAGLPQRQLHTLDETPTTKPKHVKKTAPKSPMFPTTYNAGNTFKFTKVPAELRIMIEQLVFTESSGKKPKMLWAMKGNKDLYAEAKEVWCKVNEFGFTYHESALNKIRQEMEGAERKLVKRALVTVSKDIQACTIFSPTILLFPNITHLTLRVHTTSGFSLAIHHIIPKMTNLQHITVQIQGPKRIIQAHISLNGAESFRLFLKTRIMLDKMLNQNGKCVHVGQRLQEWVWKMEGKDEVFGPKSKKVHIKFDEDAKEFALETEQEQEGSGQGS
ncbi:hypothetical protein DL98DRAFT_603648 [Cadophora sp. DSE1049]|nr:hypothetical protein DL98DRAFT_603648 [Cadophora sp. DSE1049]